MPDRDLRLATSEDAAALLAIYAPIVRETAISFELEPPSLQETARRVESGRDRYPWLVCVLEGEVAGYAYASAFRGRPAYRWTAEVSAYTGEGFRRRGVAGALYEALLGFLRMQRFHAAVGVIALPNVGSLRLHRRFGFSHVGTLREVGFKAAQWRDVDLWQRPLAGTVSGEELLPVADVASRPEWEELRARAAGRIGGE